MALMEDEIKYLREAHSRLSRQQRRLKKDDSKLEDLLHYGLGKFSLFKDLEKKAKDATKKRVLLSGNGSKHADGAVENAAKPGTTLERVKTKWKPFLQTI